MGTIWKYLVLEIEDYPFDPVLWIYRNYFSFIPSKKKILCWKPEIVRDELYRVHLQSSWVYRHISLTKYTWMWIHHTCTKWEQVVFRKFSMYFGRLYQIFHALEIAQSSPCIRYEVDKLLGFSTLEEHLGTGNSRFPFFP